MPCLHGKPDPSGRACSNGANFRDSTCTAAFAHAHSAWPRLSNQHNRRKSENVHALPFSPHIGVVATRYALHPTLPWANIVLRLQFVFITFSSILKSLLLVFLIPPLYEAVVAEWMANPPRDLQGPFCRGFEPCHHLYLTEGLTAS
ncbi:hypothetical protein PoB_004836800 [Plakobranchus ocellatus]|uniref:Uncharacterized protein n=1 Tax=Plakobranchus ocellatus TaxID=259542 RepID=A0AAV4BQK3_9GAST|nr:hypothetical protein PoB_004836800 [Plakobranchus ocellatus]